MIFHMASCGGCRTCEMACSYKHTGEFIPSISSMKILDREDEIGFDVLLVEERFEKIMICDGCRELDEPLCVQYCEKAQDLETILADFLNRCESKCE